MRCASDYSTAIVTETFIEHLTCYRKMSFYVPMRGIVRNIEYFNINEVLIVKFEKGHVIGKHIIVHFYFECLSFSIEG